MYDSLVRTAGVGGVSVYDSLVRTAGVCEPQPYVHYVGLPPHSKDLHDVIPFPG